MATSPLVIMLTCKRKIITLVIEYGIVSWDDAVFITRGLVVCRMDVNIPSILSRIFLAMFFLKCSLACIGHQ